MFVPKVREQISNLKPGVLWGIRQYGKDCKENTHMDEIVNLTPMKGNSYVKVWEFYEQLSKKFDALHTLEEADMLKGFVMTMLKKLPQVKPDLVRVDDKW